MISLKTLAKLFQFLSSCIILVEIVGEERFKLAVERSAQRLTFRRQPQIWNKVSTTFVTMWKRIEQRSILEDATAQKPEAPKQQSIIRLAAWFVAQVAYVVFIMVASSLVQQWLFDVQRASLVWKVVSYLLALICVFVVNVVVFAVVAWAVEGLALTIAGIMDRIYTVMLRAMLHLLDRDRAKRRLLVLSFLFLVIGTALDIAQE